jgi:hypothetical protein
LLARESSLQLYKTTFTFSSSVEIAVSDDKFQLATRMGFQLRADMCIFFTLGQNATIVLQTPEY